MAAAPRHADRHPDVKTTRTSRGAPPAADHVRQGLPRHARHHRAATATVAERKQPA